MNLLTKSGARSNFEQGISRNVIGSEHAEDLELDVVVVFFFLLAVSFCLPGNL